MRMNAASVGRVGWSLNCVTTPYGLLKRRTRAGPVLAPPAAAPCAQAGRERRLTKHEASPMLVRHHVVVGGQRQELDELVAQRELLEHLRAFLVLAGRV